MTVDGAVLLFSSGIASLAAWHMLDRPPVLYVDDQQPWHVVETQAVQALADSCGIDLQVSTELDASAWPGSPRYATCRTPTLVLLALRRTPRVHLAVTNDAPAVRVARDVSDVIEGLFQREGSCVWITNGLAQQTRTRRCRLVPPDYGPIHAMQPANRPTRPATYCGQSPSPRYPMPAGCDRDWHRLDTPSPATFIATSAEATSAE